MSFQLISDFKPTGDQPQAIKELLQGLRQNAPFQTLLGVTGSGKTFTMANVIAEINRPTLILSHNKTLAAQLYGEFKQFFPNNAVEYFVSYYDYYQPEAYLPVSDTYIEKDLAINQEIEKLRLSTTSALLSGRRDVVVISSVSCIYGMGNPAEFAESVIPLKKGQKLGRNVFLTKLVESLYSRNNADFRRGTFRVNGDTIDVHLAYADHALRVTFWDDEIEELYTIDPINARKIQDYEEINIYPANIFVTTRETLNKALYQIGEDMVKQTEYFREQGRYLEAKRLEERVNYDLEMMRELGYCSGIENYSRYFDGRGVGARPFCLLDYFPDDYLFVIDESHVTIPQIRAMYGGDRSRKQNLVGYGFRLPSALDNRPLQFEEFESMLHQTIFVSATPADFELQKSEGILVEQVIRPTGLLDPIIEVRPVGNQVDDLLDEVAKRVELNERVLVTTLTKRMAEELTKYMAKLGIKCRYIHSEVETLDRVEILRDLRLGKFDVLVGINLLREGLDLPEVSLVAILDADKEGFLRSARSLTQTSGRAARNVNGKVIMYADKITESMRKTIEETERRRVKQMAYNQEHGLVPTPLVKSTEQIFKQTGVLESNQEKAGEKVSYYYEKDELDIAADPVVQYMGKKELEKLLVTTEKEMHKASRDLDFMEAARLRDEVTKLKKILLKESGK